MRIGVDIDGVLADFNKAFIERIIHVTKRDLFPKRPFEIPTWHYAEHYGYSPAEVAQVWSSIATSSFFWSSLPPYSDTQEALKYLGERIRFGDDVYFITARLGIDAKKQTEQWLETHFPTAHVPPLTVLISSQKDLCAEALDLDVYIDDRDLNVENVWKLRANMTRIFLMDRPWNRNYQSPNVTRVSSVVGIALNYPETRAA